MNLRVVVTGAAALWVTRVVTASLSLPSLESALLPALFSGNVTGALPPAGTVNVRLPTTTGFGLLALALLLFAAAAATTWPGP